MTYTPSQIAAAARLVPNAISAEASLIYGRPRVDCGYKSRDWQPQEPTEAGRSDALVLLAAVTAWYEKAALHQREFVNEAIDFMCEALRSGDVQAIQIAVMAAAVAIGESMGEAG